MCDIIFDQFSNPSGVRENDTSKIEKSSKSDDIPAVMVLIQPLSSNCVCNPAVALLLSRYPMNEKGFFLYISRDRGTGKETLTSLISFTGLIRTMTAVLDSGKESPVKLLLHSFRRSGSDGVEHVEVLSKSGTFTSEKYFTAFRERY